MRKLTSILLCGTFILGASAIAMANTPVIRGRLHEQQERIQQGIHSGELNRREASRLEQQQARIRTSLEYDKLHGGVTPAERARLESRLNRASGSIYRTKHDIGHP